MSLSDGSMIARASSGSRSSISSIDPLMSANSAVTVLRSPWSSSDEPSGLILTLVSIAALLVGTGSGSAAARRLPHLRQNFELGGFVVPQALQACSMRAPHSAQNTASARLSLWHFAQIIGLRGV